MQLLWSRHLPDAIAGYDVRMIDDRISKVLMYSQSVCRQRGVGGPSFSYKDKKKNKNSAVNVSHTNFEAVDLHRNNW